MGLFAIQTASPLNTLLTTASTSITSSVGDAMAPAAGIFALVAGLFIGVKIFKKVTGART